MSLKQSIIQGKERRKPYRGAKAIERIGKMKIIRKFAEFVGYALYHGERFNEWRCPNKKCGFSVSEDYTCCPYCGQKIKFSEPPKVKVIEISIKR